MPAEALQEQQTVLLEFDKLVTALEALGVTQEELIGRLQTGGKDNA